MASLGSGSTLGRPLYATRMFGAGFRSVGHGQLLLRLGAADRISGRFGSIGVVLGGIMVPSRRRPAGSIPHPRRGHHHDEQRFEQGIRRRQPRRDAERAARTTRRHRDGVVRRRRPLRVRRRGSRRRRPEAVTSDCGSPTARHSSGRSIDARSPKPRWPTSRWPADRRWPRRRFRWRSDTHRVTASCSVVSKVVAFSPPDVNRASATRRYEPATRGDVAAHRALQRGDRNTDDDRFRRVAAGGTRRVESGWIQSAHPALRPIRFGQDVLDRSDPRTTPAQDRPTHGHHRPELGLRTPRRDALVRRDEPEPDTCR